MNNNYNNEFMMKQQQQNLPPQNMFINPINNENSNIWELANYGEKFKSLLVKYLGNYADTIKNSIGSDIYEKVSAYKNYKN